MNKISLMIFFIFLTLPLFSPDVHAKTGDEDYSKNRLRSLTAIQLLIDEDKNGTQNNFVKLKQLLRNLKGKLSFSRAINKYSSGKLLAQDSNMNFGSGVSELTVAWKIAQKEQESSKSESKHIWDALMVMTGSTLHTTLKNSKYKKSALALKKIENKLLSILLRWSKYKYSIKKKLVSKHYIRYIIKTPYRHQKVIISYKKALIGKYQNSYVWEKLVYNLISDKIHSYIIGPNSAIESFKTDSKINELSNRTRTRIISKIKKLLSGNYKIKLWKSSTLKKLVSIHRNQFHGDYTEWYENGRLKEKGMFRNGKKEDLWQTWYENKSLKSTGKYANNRKHGKWVWFYSSTKVRNRSTFRNGKLEGVELIYHENGKVEAKSYYNKGMRHGLSIKNSEIGSILEKKKYWKGKLIYFAKFSPKLVNDSSVFLFEKSWYRNGTLKSIDEYKNGLLSGNSKRWYKSGKIEAHFQYLNGQPHGKYSYWYPTGRIGIMRQYKQGRKVHFEKVWSTNGDLKSQTQYKNGKKHGVSIKFTKTREKLEQVFLNGQLVTELQFSKAGKLVKLKYWTGTGKSSFKIREYKSN